MLSRVSVVKFSIRYLRARDGSRLTVARGRGRWMRWGCGVKRAREGRMCGGGCVLVALDVALDVVVEPQQQQVLVAHCGAYVPTHSGTK